MATSKKKKSKKRSASSSTARSQSSAPKTPSEQQEQDVLPASAAYAPDAGGPEETDLDFEVEYSYVGKDLRQLAIISLGLFAVMLVIGFLM